MTEVGSVLANQFGLDLSDPHQRIVALILGDVIDRRGWRQAWAQFDPDIKQEIVNEWLRLIRDDANAFGGESENEVSSFSAPLGFLGDIVVGHGRSSFEYTTRGGNRLTAEKVSIGDGLYRVDFKAGETD